MDNRRVLSTILILFFLLSRPDPRSPVPVYEHERQRQIAEEYRTISYFNSSSYGDFNSSAGRWLPLTGLKEEDGYAWDLLPAVQDKARKQLQFVLRDSGHIEASAGGAELQSFPPDANITDLLLPVYHNVTGRARGDFVRQDRPETVRNPSLNLTSIAMTYDYFTYEFARNITADHGSIFLSLHEEEGQHITLNGVEAREIKAEMEIKTEQSLGETWFARLYGVHFPASGGIVLSTTSEKFAGLSALPHFALSKDTYELSRQLLNQSLSEAASAKRNPPMNFMPWSSLPHGGNPMSFPAPKCEYVAYLQQHPPRVNNNPAQVPLLKQIEDELRFPIGAPIPDPPPMVFSSVMFSPDCGFILESKSPPSFAPSDQLYLSGPKQEQYSKYVARFIMIIAAALTSQLSLLMRQMKESSTPSTRSRISFYMIAMMSIGDALFITFILLALFNETSFLLLIAMSFLAFFSVSFLGMKFQIEIWTVQAPEQRESERQSAAVQASRSPAPQATGTTQTLPLPATAARPVDTGATPIVLPPDQDAPAETPTPRAAAPGGNDTGNDAGSMYTRFYLTLAGLVIFSSWAIFWPGRLRGIYIYTLSFIYLSFWTPQIYRNVMRNCRKALRWEFVIGQSILRLFPFLYFYVVRENVLYLEPDTKAISALAIWVWIQAWTLASQDALGPRFFVPKGWAPPAYDYHPLLRDTSASGSGEDIESGGTLPIDFLRAEERDAPTNAWDGDKDKQSGGRDRTRKVFDCAICMQDIDVPILTSSSATGSAAHLFSRRMYMVTPCRHIFHSTCLESWMRLRLQCPICRESVPPI